MSTVFVILFKVPESIDMNGNFASELKSSKCKELAIEENLKCSQFNVLTKCTIIAQRCANVCGVD